MSFVSTMDWICAAVNFFVAIVMPVFVRYASQTSCTKWIRMSGLPHSRA